MQDKGTQGHTLETIGRMPDRVVFKRSEKQCLANLSGVCRIWKKRANGRGKSGVAEFLRILYVSVYPV